MKKCNIKLLSYNSFYRYHIYNFISYNIVISNTYITRIKCSRHLHYYKIKKFNFSLKNLKLDHNYDIDNRIILPVWAMAV